MLSAVNLGAVAKCRLQSDRQVLVAEFYGRLVCRCSWTYSKRSWLMAFIYFVWFGAGKRDSLLVEHRTRDRTVACSNPGRSGGRILFSRVKLVCWLLFGVRSSHMLPQWHVKDASHSAKSAGGRLHINTHTPLIQRSRSGLMMPLSRQSVGIYQETSSHATCQGTLGYSRLRSLSHCGLILA